MAHRIRDLLDGVPVINYIRPTIITVGYRWRDSGLMISVYISHHPYTSPEFCIPVAATATRRHLRSAVQGNLVVSYCRTKRYGHQRSFAYSGPALWNSLALTVRDPSLSLTQFCEQLKSVTFSVRV